MFERKSSFHNILKFQDTRRKIFITLALVGLYRFLLFVPLPGIATTPDLIRQNIAPGSGLNTLVDFLSMLSGSSLMRVSILALGLFPFNLTSVVLATLVPLIPRLRQRLEEDSWQMRKDMIRWNYYLAIPVAIFESFLFLFLISPNCEGRFFLLENNTIGIPSLFVASTIILLTAGSFFAVWIAELIDEYGIQRSGNLILLASNLIAQLPTEISRLIKPVWQILQMPNGIEKRQEILAVVGPLVIYFLLFFTCIWVVVHFLGAKRDIPVFYPGRRVGTRTGMPVKGTLPIFITTGEDGLLGSQFILALTTFYAPLLTCINVHWLQAAAAWIIDMFSGNSIFFGPVAFLCVVFFTFYFSDSEFKENRYGERLRLIGGSIPGVTSLGTQNYLNKINQRISILPAFLLGFLAIAPWLFNIQFGVNLSLLEGEKLIIIVLAVKNAYLYLDAELKLHGYDERLVPDSASRNGIRRW